MKITFTTNKNEHSFEVDDTFMFRLWAVSINPTGTQDYYIGVVTDLAMRAARDYDTRFTTVDLNAEAERIAHEYHEAERVEPKYDFSPDEFDEELEERGTVNDS